MVLSLCCLVFLLLSFSFLFFPPFIQIICWFGVLQITMESNRGQGGIQQLLAAEQEAQHIVNAARAGGWSVLQSFLLILSTLFICKPYLPLVDEDACSR